jgi:hypothetical protein
VHIFRNLAKEMEQHGHTLHFTCREKECVIDLLKAYNLDFISFGKPYKSTPGKLWGLLKFNLRMLRVLLKFKPDITLGHSSMYAAQMSWLLGIPHISMEDTGNMEQVRLYKPFTKTILVPDSFHLNLGKKQIRYPGNHELAYLHPNRFIPNDEYANMRIHEFTANVIRHSHILHSHILHSHIRHSHIRHSHIRYTLLRFVAWHASHDTGHPGISEATKRIAIEAFSKFGPVFITSESALPADLEPLRLAIPPEKLHDFIASASLVYGESATVASEACMLGVPAIYIDNTGRCYTREEEEKYGMVFNFTESAADQEKSIRKGIELLSTPGILDEWQQRRQKMLADKIDVTAFLVRFVEDFHRA